MGIRIVGNSLVSLPRTLSSISELMKELNLIRALMSQWMIGMSIPKSRHALSGLVSL